MSISHRYFLELSYMGGQYHGWQTQPNAVTVQQLLDQALSLLLRAPHETLGCGRTDTGVHAQQFFAHFDVGKPIGQAKTEGFLTRLNALLPGDIAVKRLIAVHDDAHARFDATSRTYQYFIHFNKDPFRREVSWLTKRIPDVSLMNEAADRLKQHVDFSAFSKSNTQVFTNNCRISEAGWSLTGDGMTFTISADRFLRNMVRAIVGTLIDIGYRKIEPEAIETIITSANRSNAGASVPACGLHLMAVKYPYIDLLEPLVPHG